MILCDLSRIFHPKIMYKVLDEMDVAGQTQQKMTIFTSIISGNLDYVREMTE